MGRKPEDDEMDDLSTRKKMPCSGAWASSWFLGYWKHALGVAGLVLVGAFAFGTYENHITDQQRDIHSKVAKVQRSVQRIATAEGATDPLGGFTDAAKTALKEQAAAMEAVATASTGAGAAYAWVSVQTSTIPWRMRPRRTGAGRSPWPEPRGRSRLGGCERCFPHRAGRRSMVPSGSCSRSQRPRRSNAERPARSGSAVP